MFPEEVIEEVKAANSVYEVISEYVNLQKTGVNYRGLCPFHGEKTPSFFVNPERQIFHCFGCGAGGSVFTFIMQYENIAFPEAVRRLAQRKGIPLPSVERKDDREEGLRKAILEANTRAHAYFQQQIASHSGEAARAYLAGRGIGEEGIKRFHLGWSLKDWEALRAALRKQGVGDEVMAKAGLIVPRPTGNGYYDRFRERVIFPVANAQGEVVAFGGRVIGKEGEPKYLNSPETPVYQKGKLLFGLDLAKARIREAGYALLVEGNLDLVTAHLAGVDNTVATMGTALTRDHLRLLKRFTHKVVLVYDGDAAGIEAAKRSLDLFLEEDLTVNSVTLPGGQDPDGFIRSQGVDAFRALLKDSVPLVDFFLEKTATKWRGEGIDGKARAVEEMLPVLVRMSNHVKRSEYVRRAAQLLDVREEAIQAELWPHLAGTKVRPTGGSPVRQVTRRRYAEEEELVRAMLLSRPLAVKIMEDVPLVHYQDERCRTVASAIYQDLERGTADERPGVPSLEDPEAAALAARLVAEEELVGDLERTALDSLTRLRRSRLTRELEEIQDKIRRAEASGERAVIDELLRIKQSIARA